MYTVGSLFSGIGGIDLAFDRAGFEISWQVEIDDYCNQILSRHWPNVKRWRDVRTATGSELARVDVMVGGFPCQDISVAGRGAGIIEGNRSGLWFEFGRLIGDIRPRIVLLENVAAILSRDGIRVISDLTALGYDCEWGIIRASDAGAPHQRERWFCVAYSTNAGFSAGNASRQPQDGTKSGAGMESKPERCCTVENALQSGSSSEWIETQQRQSSADLTIASGGAEVGGFFPFMGNTESQRQQRNRSGGECVSPARSNRTSNGTRQPQSVLGRAVDGLSAGLDRSQWPVPPGSIQHEWESPRVVGKLPNRAARLKALGNAVVPQVIYPIAVSIREWLQAQDEIAR